jgi:hypothetical protein
MTLVQKTIMFENYNFIVEYYNSEFNDVDEVDITPTCNGGAKLLRNDESYERVWNHVMNTIINK